MSPFEETPSEFVPIYTCGNHGATTTVFSVLIELEVGDIFSRFHTVQACDGKTFICVLMDGFAVSETRCAMLSAPQNVRQHLLPRFFQGSMLCDYWCDMPARLPHQTTSLVAMFTSTNFYHTVTSRTLR